MDLSGIKWNRKSIRLYDVILSRNKFTGFIVQLPSQLHQSGPVFAIAYRGSIGGWKTGGLGIKNQEHKANFLKILNIIIAKTLVFITKWLRFRKKCNINKTTFLKCQKKGMLTTFENLQTKESVTL